MAENAEYLVGLNYWPRHSGPFMWRDWRPGLIRGEVRQMAEMGLNVVRFFLFTPDFLPSPVEVNEVMMERLGEFLDICKETGIGAIPTLIVGHMSGENWDVPWRGGRSLYSDPEVVGAFELLCTRVASRYGNHPALRGWILSNEMPLYGGPGERADVAAWASRLAEAIRKVDPVHPVGAGDGAWGPEVSGRESGFSLDEIAPVVDFLGPHTYPVERDALRHSFTASSLVAAVRRYGKPCILEEFGCSSDHASDDNAAAYYRTCLHSTLLAGASGALGWCYSDFDLPEQAPYSHHPFELSFGVTRTDGTAKPAGLELGEFAGLVRRVEADRGRVCDPEADIIVPSYYHVDYPFSWQDRDAMRAIMLEAHVLTRCAGVRTNFIREDADPLRPGEKRLVMAPSTQKLTASYWKQIEEYVRAGGTFYCSYFAGAVPVHVGMWAFGFERLFGCRHRLTYGLVDSPPRPVEVEFEEGFGDIRPGASCVLDPEGSWTGQAYCPVEPTSARVIARDQGGWPVLLKNALGKGTVYFCTYPIEYYLAASVDSPNRAECATIYRALFREAGLAGGWEFRPGKPKYGTGVETSVLSTYDPDCRLVWAVNHLWQPVEGEIAPRDNRGGDWEADNYLTGERLGTIRAGAGLKVALGEKSVLVVRVRAR
ncbi:MAG: cellulase family glycosylhydrolase [Clostridia bacterium]|nr:cellulase family glycosylhydrolase [Clostridia bacterium]